jgi:arsenate reductase
VGSTAPVTEIGAGPETKPGRRGSGAAFLAECLGSALLACAVIGSGIAAQRLSPGDVGLQLLENSLATAFALVALISALGPVSGAHLNPVVTLVEVGRGRLPLADGVAYVSAQVAGACAGALLANAMFDLPLVAISTHERAKGAAWLSEVVATGGLLLVSHGSAAAGPRGTALAVAAWIGGAYWFTSSTAFANPAVTVARSLSDTFAGIAPSSLPAFVLAQGGGAVVGCLALAALFPKRRT